MKKPLRLLASFALGCGLAVALPAQAADYTLFDLGSLTPGQQMWATGINDLGQVVGYSYGDGRSGESASNLYHAFVTGANGSNLQPLGSLNGQPLFGRGINDSGQVAGTYGSDFTYGNAFVGTPGGTETHLDFHGVEGYEYGNLGGFGQYGPISNSQAFALNDSGQVAGMFTNGRIARYYGFITGPDGQGVINLDTLFPLASGDYFVSATGVNNLGQFIANTELGHAYLISPIPEPATLALWGAGLLLVGGAVRGSRGRSTATTRNLPAAMPMPC